MIKITLKREITGKEYVKEMKNKYGTIEKLTKICETHDDNPVIALELDDWEYFQNHPNEMMEEKRILYNPKFSANDLEILDIVKNKKPESITELAKIINKDVSNVQRKINKLEDEGLLELTTGNINNMKTPVFNYDKIEIAI